MQSLEREPVRLYQPIWCNGGVNGYYQFQRDCGERYGVIRKLASRFNRPFSVLDIGSNYGYFPVRLMEDFPQAVCVLIDNKEVEPVLRENRMLDRSVVIKRKVTAGELEALSRSESFDIVLGLSVLHHFDDPVRAHRAMRNLGWWSVFEIPGEDDIGAAFPEKHRTIRGLFGDPDGHFQSHVSDSKRPYFVLENRPFIEEQSVDAADRDAPGYSRYELEVDFDRSLFKKQGEEPRDFVPGMNLYNFIRLGGGWPTGELIDKECEQYQDHPDFYPWNFVVGNQITPIDQVRK